MSQMWDFYKKNEDREYWHRYGWVRTPEQGPESPLRGLRRSGPTSSWT